MIKMFQETQLALFCPHVFKLNFNAMIEDKYLYDFHFVLPSTKSSSMAYLNSILVSGEEKDVIELIQKLKTSDVLELFESFLRTIKVRGKIFGSFGSKLIPLIRVKCDDDFSIIRFMTNEIIPVLSTLYYLITYKVFQDVKFSLTRFGGDEYLVLDFRMDEELSFTIILAEFKSYIQAHGGEVSADFLAYILAFNKAWKGGMQEEIRKQMSNFIDQSFQDSFAKFLH